MRTSFGKVDLEKLNKAVPKGKVAFKWAEHDYEICDSILAMYSFTGFLPTAAQMLFCSKQTTLNEVENFMWRAKYAPKNFKKSAGERLFTIVNF